MAIGGMHSSTHEDLVFLRLASRSYHEGLDAVVFQLGLVHAVVVIIIDQGIVPYRCGRETNPLLLCAQASGPGEAA
jgi:acid phosphatase family membrane protein YuiD